MLVMMNFEILQMRAQALGTPATEMGAKVTVVVCQEYLMPTAEDL